MNTGVAESIVEEAIGQALLTITSLDAHGWFQHCRCLFSNERKS